MFDKLSALGNPVSEVDLIQVLFNGLESSYRPFIRSIQQCQNDMTFDELYSLLLCEEYDINVANSSINQAPPSTFFIPSTTNDSPHDGRSFSPHGGYGGCSFRGHGRG